MALMLIIAIISANSFSTLGIICSRTQATSYRDAWGKVIGESTAWIPAGCVVVSYSIILADAIPDVIGALFGASSISLDRQQVLLVVTVAILLPLCLLRDLDKLKPFSFLGTVAMLFVVLAMTHRYWTGGYTPDDSSSSVQKNSDTLETPKFGNRGWQAVWSSNTTIFVSMLSTAFMGHFNAPKFFWGLERNTMHRFNIVTTWSYLGALTISASIAAVGFLTFGSACKGNILDNYSTSDHLITLARSAIIVSVISTYALTFMGLRDGVMDLTGRQEDQDQLFFSLIVLLLGAVTMAAIVIQDISFVVAFTGATWGTSLIYIYPSVMLIRLSNTQEDLKRHVLFAIITGLIGLGLMLVGTERALQMI
eukprot:scaffold37433_cov199-Amphora_coffeaeformis.AAC.2